MERKLRSLLPILIMVVLVLVVIGCSTVKKQVEVPDVAQKISPKGDDYLGKNVVLARFIWEDFFEAIFFPANILTEAS
ncbi:hypothetical protein WKV44_10380, partial [Spirochaetia bacterium 38H-sp]